MPIFIEYSIKSINQEYGNNFDGGGIFRTHEAYETFMTHELRRTKARCCIVKYETEISQEEFDKIRKEIQERNGYPGIQQEHDLTSAK